MTAALRLRHVAVVYAPALAGVLIAAGFFLDPAIDESGRELAREYAAAPGREQVSALALHFAFALLALPAVACIVLARTRGAWLGTVAAFFGVLGLTTLPGFLLTDFYDIAIYGELGGDAWQAVNDRIEELPGATIMFLTGFLGFFLALPTALLAAWRERVLPWWPAAVVLAGGILAQAVPDGYGLLLWAASLVALTVALRRLPREPAVAAGPGTVRT